jgi:hypothetical protein
MEKKFFKSMVSILLFIVLTTGLIFYTTISVCANNNLLTASQQDIENLNYQINNVYYFFKDGYDYENTSMRKLVANIAFSYTEYRVDNTEDPLNRLYKQMPSYEKIPEKEMDNTIINVFNSIPDHNYEAKGNDWYEGYYFDGYYYYQIDGLGGVFPKHNITDYKQLSNGKYIITAIGIEPFEGYGVVPTIYLLVDLKLIDNERTWTFYNISNNINEIKNSSAYVDESPSISVILNGKKLSFSEQPYIENGTTRVPMRAIFEALDAEVDYEASTKTITARKGSTAIKLVTGSSTATINGKQMALTASVENKNGTTMVPLRFVSEALGAEVIWDGDTKVITINSK